MVKFENVEKKKKRKEKKIRRSKILAVFCMTFEIDKYQ